MTYLGWIDGLQLQTTLPLASQATNLASEGFLSFAREAGDIVGFQLKAAAPAKRVKGFKGPLALCRRSLAFLRMPGRPSSAC